jgi:hypothetical protein
MAALSSALDRLEQLDRERRSRAGEPLGGFRRRPDLGEPATDAPTDAPADVQVDPSARAVAAATPAAPPAAARPVAETPPARGRPVRGGPLAYRKRLRRLGPLLGLLAPAAVLLLAVAFRATSPDQGIDGIKAAFSSWVLVLLALPTATAAGLPWTTSGDGLLVAGATSAVAWAGIGWLAALRATRQPVATWRDWAKEYAVLAVAVWAGAVTGLVAVGWFLTHGA